VSSPRILIIRTSALGDIVQALPVLRAVRRHHPHATIGWVVEDAFAPLLQGHPDIDELLRVRLRVWRKDVLSRANRRELTAFLRQLYDFSPDIVLDLMGNHKAGIIGALTLSDRRVGLSYDSRREPSSSIWLSEKVSTHAEHAVDRMLAVLDGIGLPPESADFGADKLHESLPAKSPVGSDYVLLHPATGWLNKDYPPNSWARVAHRLEVAGFPVVIVPGPGEEALAESIRSASGSDVQVLSSTSLPGLIYLQRRAVLVLGGDTGPIHLAHALGTDVLCVMGPTDPRRHGPYKALDKAIWIELPCSFCHKRLNSPKACLLELDPDAVADRAIEILHSKLH
jgi:heptosyltransferase-1